MQRTPVESSAIVAVGYDAKTRELEIEFRGGRVYRYRDVPSHVHQFLIRAPSKGAYVNRVIAPRFAYRQLGDEARDEDLGSKLEASLQMRPRSSRER